MLAGRVDGVDLYVLRQFGHGPWPAGLPEEGRILGLEALAGGPPSPVWTAASLSERNLGRRMVKSSLGRDGLRTEEAGDLGKSGSCVIPVGMSDNSCRKEQAVRSIIIGDLATDLGVEDVDIARRQFGE